MCNISLVAKIIQAEPELAEKTPIKEELESMNICKDGGGKKAYNVD